MGMVVVTLACFTCVLAVLGSRVLWQAVSELWSWKRFGLGKAYIEGWHGQETEKVASGVGIWKGSCQQGLGKGTTRPGLASNLLHLWAAGILSASLVQTLAELAMMDGQSHPELVQMASTGNAIDRS